MHKDSVGVWVGLIGAGLLWVVPFLQPFHTAPIPTFYSEWGTFLISAAALCGYAFAFPRTRLAVPRIVWYLSILIALVLVQATVTPHTYMSQVLTWILYLGLAIALSVLGASLASQFGTEKVVRVMAWFALAGGLAGALAYTAFIATNTQEFANGLIAQRNHLASQLSIAMAALLYLFSTRRVSIVVATLAGLLLTIGLSLTTARSVFLYLVSFAALSYLFFSRGTGTDKLHGYRLLGASILTISVLLILQLFFAAFGLNSGGGGTTLERIAAGGNLTIRLAEWATAWEIFVSAPWIGVGVDQYAWHSFQHYSVHPGGSIFSHAHNLFLHLAAETGLAGLVIVSIPLALWVIRILRTHLSSESWFALAVFLTLFIHSNLEFPLWHAYFLAIGALVFGMFDKHVLLTVRGSPEFVRVALMLLFAGFLVTSLSTLSAYSQLENLAFENRYRSDPDFYPVHRALLQQVSKNPILRPNAEFMQGALIALDETDIDTKLELSGRISRWRPVSENVYRHAILLAIKGEQTASIREIQRAVAIYPDEREHIVKLIRGLGSKNLAVLENELETTRHTGTN